MRKFDGLLPIGNGDVVILDTDIGSDCDDCGALAVLVYGCEQCGAKIGAVINDTDNPYGCGTIDAILSYYGYELPIGMTTDRGFMGVDDPVNIKYNKPVAEQFSEKFRKGELKTRTALEVYREVLKKAEDKQVVLITIGFLNTAAEILQAEPALFKEKVRCVVSMAGDFEDVSRPEWNVVKQPMAAKMFYENCPVPVFFNGVEIGNRFKTGFEMLMPKNPVSVAYQIHSGGMRASFDPAAVDFAFCGVGEDWEISDDFAVEIMENGAMKLHKAENANACCVRFASEEAIERIQERLNSIDKR